MDKLQKWLQKWLMPIAEVLEKQKHLQAVKDGIVGIVPIIIIGSFCLVPTGIGNMLGGGISEWVNAHNKVITLPTYFTTNIMSLYAALFIANSLAKIRKAFVCYLLEFFVQLSGGNYSACLQGGDF